MSCLSASLLAQTIASVPVSTPVRTGSEAHAVATMVRGIASFTRWPVAPNPVRICLVGQSALAEAWLSAEGTSAALFRAEGGAKLPAERCDIAFIGKLAPGDLAATYARLQSGAVVSITDNDPQCRSGAMFCLAAAPAGLTFSLNIDAVSRSAVRIDPRVLRLASSAS